VFGVLQLLEGSYKDKTHGFTLDEGLLLLYILLAILTTKAEKSEVTSSLRDTAESARRIQIFAIVYCRFSFVIYKLK